MVKFELEAKPLSMFLRHMLSAVYAVLSCGYSIAYCYRTIILYRTWGIYPYRTQLIIKLKIRKPSLLCMLFLVFVIYWSLLSFFQFILKYHILLLYRFNCLHFRYSFLRVHHPARKYKNGSSV